MWTRCVFFPTSIYSCGITYSNPPLVQCICCYSLTDQTLHLYLKSDCRQTPISVNGAFTFFRLILVQTNHQPVEILHLLAQISFLWYKTLVEKQETMHNSAALLFLVSDSRADYGPAFTQRKGVTDPLRPRGPSLRPHRGPDPRGGVLLPRRAQCWR